MPNLPLSESQLRLIPPTTPLIGDRVRADYGCMNAPGPLGRVVGITSSQFYDRIAVVMWDDCTFDTVVGDYVQGARIGVHLLRRGEPEFFNT